MKFGFDIDETITAKPEIFREIMFSLSNMANEVFVISGLTSDHLAPSREARVAQLEKLGISRHSHYKELLLCPIVDAGYGPAHIYGGWKRQICVDLGIEVMFEDRGDLIDMMIPAVTCFWLKY